ncbi:MAG: DNA recombination protein RmuC [Bacteroidales bacterium]|jgi:DNA recombination protein RmuC|nr:DNA recombination protein RmuC [Bacteroidales bacterium]
MENIFIIIVAVIAVGAIVFAFLSKRQFEKDKASLSEQLNDLRQREVTIATKEASLSAQLNTKVEDLKRREVEVATKEERINILTAENSALGTQVEDLRRREVEVATKEERINNLTAENSALKTQNENVKKEIAELQERSKQEFKNLAQEILEAQSKKFTESSTLNLKTVLDPLSTNINEFKKKVEDQHLNNAKQTAALGATIKDLTERTVQISQGANNLADALKGSKKIQGDWGEQQLETLLLNAGLIKGETFFVQENVKGEDDNNLRPDFIVKLPNGNSVVIDAKVTLNSFVDYSNATTDDDRSASLERFTKAIKNHIDELYKKDYEKYVTDSIDSVLLFIPIEAAYLLALQEDASLWKYAFEKNILLISPSNLMTALRLIADLWQREKQDKNVIKIINMAEGLYKKFVTFGSTFEKIGKNIVTLQGSYETAIGQLSAGKDNLVKKAERLHTLGAKAKDKLPPALLESANSVIEDTDFEEV